MPRASTAIELMILGTVTTLWAAHRANQQVFYDNANGAGGYTSTQPYGGSGADGGWNGSHYYYVPHGGGWYGGGYYGGGYSGGGYTDHGGFAHGSASVSRGGFGSIGHALGGHS